MPSRATWRELNQLTEALGRVTHLRIHMVRWNPGDGARYRIETHGGQPVFGSRYRPAGEMRSALWLALAVVAADTRHAAEELTDYGEWIDDAVNTPRLGR